MAGYLKSLAQHARNVPTKFLPEILFKTATALKNPGAAGRGRGRMDPTPESKSEKPEKSYLTAAVDSISPWGSSRSSTPKAAPSPTSRETPELKNQHGGDHTTQAWGFGAHRYSPDCPPLNARWYYAVDVPKILLQNEALANSRYRFLNESPTC